MKWYTPLRFGINRLAGKSTDLCNVHAGSLSGELFTLCKPSKKIVNPMVSYKADFATHANFINDNIENTIIKCNKTANEIIVKLAKYMTETGETPTKNEILKNPVIDLSHTAKFLNPDKNTLSYNYKFKTDGEFADEEAYINEHNWTALIPCYTKGLYKIHPNRYIYYDVENINKDEHSVTVFHQEYINVGNYFLPGHSSKATISLSKGKSDKNDCFTVERHEFQNETSLYKPITPKQLNLTDFEAKFYRQLINDITKSDKIYNNVITNELNSAFIKATVRTNFLLSKYKPNRESNSYYVKNDTENEKNIIYDAPQSHYVQRIGPVNIYNDTAPKQTVRKQRTNDIHYKIPEWDTRGHIRHYKSGKTVYVKPSVHKRQGMTGEKPQKTIEFMPEKSKKPKMFDLNTLKNT